MAPAWNPSPQGSGEANCCFQCLENPAEFSCKSPACLVQIWIGLIKKPQQQSEFCPAVSLAGAWSPSTVCQGHLNARPGVCTQVNHLLD